MFTQMALAGHVCSPQAGQTARYICQMKPCLHMNRSWEKTPLQFQVMNWWQCSWDAANTAAFYFPVIDPCEIVEMIHAACKRFPENNTHMFIDLFQSRP